MTDHLKGHASLAEMVSTHIASFREALKCIRGDVLEVVNGDYWQHELNALSDIEHACTVERAARATAEQSTFALQALVAAGHVSQAKVNEALSIASKTPGIRASEQSQSDAWKEYAQHLEHCAQCSQMSYADCDEGTRLHDDANSIESQQDAAIESMPAEQSADAKDAARYRWLRDETSQDSLARPFGIAISILAPHRNEAGNFDIDGWAVTYEEDADAAIDAAIESQRSGNV